MGCGCSHLEIKSCKPHASSADMQLVVSNVNECCVADLPDPTPIEDFLDDGWAGVAPCLCNPLWVTVGSDTYISTDSGVSWTHIHANICDYTVPAGIDVDQMLFYALGGNLPNANVCPIIRICYDDGSNCYLAFNPDAENDPSLLMQMKNQPIGIMLRKSPVNEVGTQAFPATDLSWSTIEWEFDGSLGVSLHDIPTNSIEVPIDGVYFFTLSIAFETANANEGFGVRLTPIGGLRNIAKTINKFNLGGGNKFIMSVSGLYYLQAGDKIKGQPFVTGGTASVLLIPNSENTYFGCHLVKRIT